MLAFANKASKEMQERMHDRIKRDDLVVLSGVGAGFTFGATVLRWY